MRYAYLQGFTSEGRMVDTVCAGKYDGEHLHYVTVYTETSPWDPRPEQITMMAWAKHNRDDRPRGHEIRSMSAGDVVVVNNAQVFFCDSVGWAELTGEVAQKLLDASKRNAYVTVRSEAVWMQVRGARRAAGHEE